MEDDTNDYELYEQAASIALTPEIKAFLQRLPIEIDKNDTLYLYQDNADQDEAQFAFPTHKALIETITSLCENHSDIIKYHGK